MTTDKLLIERELLERVVKADASNGASSVDLVDGWKAMEQIRAILSAPRQPEGELEVVGFVRSDGALFSKSEAKELPAFVASSLDEACRLSDAQRAIAELREECERLRLKVTLFNDGKPYAALKAERDTLRQQIDVITKDRDDCLEARLHYVGKYGEALAQRDKLAGLLERIANHHIDGNIRPTVRDCVIGRPDVQDIYGYCDEIEAEICAALAEVKPCAESPHPAAT